MPGDGRQYQTRVMCNGEKEKCEAGVGGWSCQNLLSHVAPCYKCYSCCIVLRPRLTSKVMSGRSVNLTTLFLGRLRPPKRLTTTLYVL